MVRPDAFVGYSSTDIGYYRLMLAWRTHFDFWDCQLQNELGSQDDTGIKRDYQGRINVGDTYLMLIGADTRFKHKYARWAAELALEKRCRIIGVNLDNWRRMNEQTCPPVIRDIGALFIPFSLDIIAHALNHFKREE